MGLIRNICNNWVFQKRLSKVILPQEIVNLWNASLKYFKVCFANFKLELHNLLFKVKVKV